MTQYLVIYEGGGDSWSAYSPDVEGCVAAGETREEVEQLMREAIPMHIAELRAHGEAVPEPSSCAGYIAA